MENGSETQGHVAQRVRETDNREGIERPNRQHGKHPGTFSQRCVICGGQGTVWTTASLANPDAQLADPPYRELCLSCDGQGYIVCDGEREGDADRRTQPTWGDVAWMCLWTAVITAGFCWLLIWRARGH